MDRGSTNNKLSILSGLLDYYTEPAIFKPPDPCVRIGIRDASPDRVRKTAFAGLKRNRRILDCARTDLIQHIPRLYEFICSSASANFFYSCLTDHSSVSSSGSIATAIITQDAPLIMTSSLCCTATATAQLLDFDDCSFPAYS